MRPMLVEGSVAARFQPVRAVFERIVDASPGTGCAMAVWRDGAWVVDLWGGYRDTARSRPWQRDTLVMPYSVTKPFAAACVLLLVDRGQVALDAPVTWYWPGLRTTATVRETLAHGSGIVLLDEPPPQESFYDWDALVRRIEDQDPTLAPGQDAGECALLYGHLLGEVVRRVDGRSLGSFLREEVCGPLGLDFHVGVPTQDLERVADLTGYGEGLRRALGERPGLMVRALANPPGALDPDVVNARRWRQAEVPAVNGHGTARGVAGLFAALAEDRLLSRSLREEMTSDVFSGYDHVVGDTCRWGLGVGIDEDGWGMGGVGGSYGGWSEVGGYAIGFVTGYIEDFERLAALEDALRGCLALPPV